MRNVLAGLVAVAVMGCARGGAQERGVLGMWQEPGGAKIEVHRCGAEVCAKLLTLSRDAPTKVDEKNPETGLRSRALVGLEIGQGFHLDDPAHAEGGKIYDPKSGRTYHGSMVSDGDQLKLRGYVGIKAFGRTEVWTRDGGK